MAGKGATRRLEDEDERERERRDPRSPSLGGTGGRGGSREPGKILGLGGRPLLGFILRRGRASVSSLSFAGLLVSSLQAHGELLDSSKGT